MLQTKKQGKSELSQISKGSHHVVAQVANGDHLPRGQGLPNHGRDCYSLILEYQ